MGTSLTPPYDALLSMSHTHTVDMVADEYGVTERTAYYWFRKNGLHPVPKPKGGHKKENLNLEYIIQSVERGIPLGDIADMCHVCKATISAKLKEAGTSYKEIAMGKHIEENTGHYCSQNLAVKHDCKYWHKCVGCCDYILIEGHSRPCPANACTVYEKGSHIRSCNTDIIF